MPYLDPAEKREADRIRNRHLEDAHLLMQLLCQWRESPRSSEDHKRGMSRLVAAWTEIKGEWGLDGIPLPRVTERALLKAKRATIYSENGGKG